VKPAGMMISGNGILEHEDRKEGRNRYRDHHRVRERPAANQDDRLNRRGTICRKRRKESND
jgi:hypothetical protein